MTSTPHPADGDERIPFVLGLAAAFHAAGYSTHRIEESLEDIVERLGIEGQFFSTPTSIFASFGRGERQRTYMQRTRPTPPDLGRMVAVTAIARRVLRGEARPAEGTAALAALATRGESEDLAHIAAFALASGSAARFLGGAGPEVAVAGMAGLMIGVLAMALRHLPNGARVFELAAAALCSFAVAAAGAKVPGFSVPIATLAGLIVLIPGLTLTTSITEIAYDHLSAGTARMAGAFMTFIGIGFGVALGSRVAAALAGPATPHTPPPTPEWTAILALLVSAIAFAILLRADRRDVRWIVPAAAVGYAATRLGVSILGPELGVFVGALVIGLGSNLFNRLTERPAMVTLVPGLLTLVPGSVGYRSITALLESQVVAGIDTAFTMVLTAVSLVAGLLTAAAVFPERRIA